MKPESIEFIGIPSNVNENEYTALKNYLAYLPIEVGSSDRVYVEIHYSPKGNDDTKIVVITPYGDSFSNVSIKVNTLGEKKFEFKFYACFKKVRCLFKVK